MRVILTGGCTGGHIYPALAIGDRFRKADPENEVIYIGHQFGMETSIVPSAGYELKIVTADWLRRDNPIRMLKTLANTMKGKKEALKVMKEFKPDVVISTGSFVSVPVVLAAHSYGAPIYMQEQNGFPGVSNKAFSNWAKRIFLGFDSARQYFKASDEKLIYSGNPVRLDFHNRDKAADRKALGISNEDIVITVFGGSLGSDTTNEIGEALIKEYGGKAGYVIVFGTGREYFDEVSKKLADEKLDQFNNIKLMPYIKDMPSVMSASDLVVSRSGALSVAETTMAGRAAIFVPSPNVTADHQYYNAKAVSDIGGAIIVRENEHTAEEVLEAVKIIAGDKETLTKMGEASAKIAPTEATNIIYQTIMETYK